MAEKQEKVPAVVSVLGFVVGAISTFAVSSLSQSPSLFAAVVGGICGAGAVDPHESVFEEIGWAHVALFVMIYIGILSLGPWDDDSFMLAALWFLGNVLLAAAIGGYAGGLVFKLWKALVPRRFRDHLKPQEPLPAKWMAENEEKIPEVVYFLGLVAGAISAYAVAEWLNWPLAQSAAFLGGLAGFFGVAQRESIFRALAEILAGVGCMSITIAIIAIIIALLPGLPDWVAEIALLLMLTIFAIVGWFTGVLVFNLWKAIAR